MSVPIPSFTKVVEVVQADTSVALIAPDYNAGLPGRYSVVRVMFDGKASCIGRELPLWLARRVAERPAVEDGLPVR